MRGGIGAQRVSSFHGRWPVSRADQVRAYLAAVDAKCPKCRYSLKGLRDPRCPECGLELDVATINGRRWRLVPESVSAGARWAVLVNIALAFAVIGSSIAHHGALPRLAWLAPAVLGGFACSLAYWPVFLKVRAGPIEPPSSAIGAAWLAAAMQAGGLVLLWT